MGYDFGSVRVHDHPYAAQAAKSLNARAFTIGKDIVFGRGQFSPESDSGKRLIGHELAHVVQQGIDKPYSLSALEKSRTGGGARDSDAERGGNAEFGPNGQKSTGELSPVSAGNASVLIQLSPKLCDPELLKETGSYGAPDPEAFHGIEIYYNVRTLPYSSICCITYDKHGPYIVTPSLRRRGEIPTVVYYVAFNDSKDHRRNEFVIGPDSITRFLSNVETYEKIADLAYAYTYPGRQPAEYQAESARFVSSLVRGGSGSGDALLRSWGAAARDPSWWTQVIMSFASAVSTVPESVPASPGPPSLTVIRGGGGSVAAAASAQPAAAPAVIGNTAVAVGEAPQAVAAPAAVLRSVPMPAPGPEVSPISIGSTLPAAAPLAVAIPALAPSHHPAPEPESAEEKKKKKRPPFILRLPWQKAPHLGRYRSWLGVLQSDPNYERGNPNQLEKWHQALRIGGSHAIPASVYERGHRLGLTGAAGERRIRVPDWSRTKSILMEVDHIVELQATPAFMREVFNSMENLELLDRKSNGTSGPLIQSNIEAERRIQVAFDPSLANAVLIFDDVVLDGGTTGERWSVDEIRAGEQLDEYEGHVKQ